MASLYSRKWTVAMRNIGRCLVGTSAQLGDFYRLLILRCCGSPATL